MTITDKNRERFETYLKRNRVFILGAGFSAGAGVPLTPELLAKTMAKFSAECPGIFARVNGYAQEAIGSIGSKVDYSRINFSDLCTFLEFIELREYGGGERWSDAGSREKLALRFYLSKTLVECTPSQETVPTMYVEFAKQLHQRDIVISFNWDTLLEAALNRVGKTYTYNLSDMDSVRLRKLHGSVNWRLGEPRNLRGPIDTLNWQSLHLSEGRMPQEIYSTSALLHFPTWRYYSPLGEVQPFLVLPGYGKAFDVRFNAVLWYKPDFAFGSTHDVYIIGLSLAPDDFFIRSFFLSSLPYIQSYSGVEGRRIYIVNPDPESVKNYDFVLSKGHAELLNQPFSVDHVSLMKERLASG